MIIADYCQETGFRLGPPGGVTRGNAGGRGVGPAESCQIMDVGGRCSGKVINPEHNLPLSFTNENRQIAWGFTPAGCFLGMWPLHLKRRKSAARWFP